MARLLLDENQARTTLAALVVAGLDVVSVADVEPGASDRRVLAIARDQRRILVTFDSDFGELVFQRGESLPPAILYLRLQPIDPLMVAVLVADALHSEVDGFMVVCTREGTRLRPLPGSEPAGGRR